MTIDETCSCGARVSIVDSFAPHAKSEAAEWRANHRHEMPERAPIDRGDCTTTAYSVGFTPTTMPHNPSMEDA